MGAAHTCNMRLSRRGRLLVALTATLLLSCDSVDPPFDDGRSWTAEVRVDDSSFQGFRPALALNDDGEAVVVWYHPTTAQDTGYAIFANRFVPGADWGTPVQVSFAFQSEGAEVNRPQVAIDPMGNAIAVWQQVREDGNFQFDIWSSRSTPEGGWDEAVRIEDDDSGAAIAPQIAMDDAGDAIAVWQQFDGERFNMLSNRYVPGEGWGNAERIETDDVSDAVDVQISGDGAGNAVAVWMQSDGTRFNIWANRYTPTGGWGTARPIEDNNAVDTNAPQVAVSESGSATAIWEQIDDAGTRAWAAQFSREAGWQLPQPVGDASGDDESVPQVGVDAEGNAVAVWLQRTGGTFEIRAGLWSEDEGWSESEAISSIDQFALRVPRVAVGEPGNAVVVWRGATSDVAGGLFSNRYDPRGGWGTPTRIESIEDAEVRTPRIRVRVNGDAMTVWNGRERFVWSSRLE